MKKATFPFVLLILLTAAVFSQVPSPLVFTRITKEQGLASNTVFQTVRDAQGFLWVATQNGLQRYDGMRFLTFRHRPGDKSSISENTINHLFIDSKQRLWLMFDKSLGIFDTRKFTFHEIRISGTVNRVKKLVEDEKGQLILFADAKQLLLDERMLQFAKPFIIPDLPQGYSIGDMAIDRQKKLYLFTGKQGSLIYDFSKQQWKPTKNLSDMNSMSDSFCSVKNSRYPYVSSDGSWWMVNWIPFTGGPPVLYRYNMDKNMLQKYEKIRAYKADSYYEIWNVFEQRNGTIWIYGMGLLAYYDTKISRFVHISSNRFQPNGIDYDMVSHLYEDAEKNVWVSTNNGLYRFNTNAQVFQNMPNRRWNDTTIFNNAVSAIVETKTNGIWVGTWGAGVFTYDHSLQPIPNPMNTADPKNKSLHISYMAHRRNGEVWIGTQTGNIKIFDPSAKACYSFTHSLLGAETITQLMEDHEGNMWIGSNSGKLVKCNNGNWKDSATSFSMVLTNITDVMKLYQDHHRHIWVCTSMDGVYELNPDGKKIIRHIKEGIDKNDGLLNDGATDIVHYNDSTYLIASDGICILNTRTNTFRYLIAGEDLPSEHITTLVTDRNKRLWVGLDGGLYRITDLGKKMYLSYGHKDGIMNNIFQVSATAVLKDGRIILGTPKDFMIFDPERTIKRYPLPVVTITGVSVGEGILNVDSLQQLPELTLAYDNTFIKIDVSTLTFSGNNAVLYKLEGLDKNWKEVANGTIVYQYLPPGNYILTVKSRNNERDGNEKITKLKIHVSAPFWKTWWFFSLLLLCIGAVLFAFDRWRMQRLQAMQQMRSNIAGNLHKDISTTLDNISVLSEMAKMKADTEPEKSKDFIEQIHSKSRNMTLAMEDILWSIDPENDNMHQLVQRLKEYVTMLKNRYLVQIDLLADEKLYQLRLNMEMRKEVFWFFRNGITTVVTSGGTNNRIHITYEKNYLLYMLEFDTARLNHEQINNLRQRRELTEKLEALHATLNFTEHSSKAEFLLKIPLKGTMI